MHKSIKLNYFEHINIFQSCYQPGIDNKSSNFIPEMVSCLEIKIQGVFRWFKFTLKPPNRITRDKLRLAIWDTSAWTFWLKFGHKGP